MDMMSGQQSLLGGNQFTMGSVNGEKIDWTRFSRIEELLYRGSSTDVYSRRNQLWNYFVEESIINKESEELGIGISKRELTDFQFGTNLSPVILQRFQDPNTGQINREQLNFYRDQIANKTLTDPTLRAFWAHQEKEIIKDAKQNKINAIVSQSLFTPTWMAEMGNADMNLRIDFAYVLVPYSEINNSEITLSNSDYRKYIQEHKALLEQKEETRDLDYVVFDVLPSAADTAKWQKTIDDLIVEFKAEQDDSLFVERNYGSISANYFTKAEISSTIGDVLDSIAIGDVHGPYLENGAYNAVKLLSRVLMSDSADTRHILINASTPEQFSIAEKRIDSLKNVLESGAASFDSLAIKFSQDPGSASKGGKYENITPNMFVPTYNEVLFVTGQIGKLEKVRSDFGWHLVEVLKRSQSKTMRYKVAYINQLIVPSEETTTQIFDDVNELVSGLKTIDQLEKLVNDRKNLDVQSAKGLKANDFTIFSLGAGQSSRDMIRWAFESSSGTVSPEVYSFQNPATLYINKYVVAALRAVHKPGLPAVESVKDDIEIELLKEKKGELFKSQLAGKSMKDIAAQYGISIDTIRSVSFNQGSIQNIGSEPKVIANAFALEPGNISEVIPGNSGVFVVESLNKPNSFGDPNIPLIRNQMTAETKIQVSAQLLQALKSASSVKDDRFKFY